MPVRSWSELPVGRVVRLDADAEAVAVSIDPLPPGAPAILTWLPGEPRSVAGLVASVLRELDEAAIALFPAWLPEAAGIEGPAARTCRPSARWRCAGRPPASTTARSWPSWPSGR
ncbi:hypothetical protein ACFQQB_00795 [Nonomuraea rubra]|uniref:hypothetical protein n=1 Tax=Nonomuraea rubra TaxID=46180 RepID=UPI00360D58D3